MFVCELWMSLLAYHGKQIQQILEQKRIVLPVVREGQEVEVTVVVAEVEAGVGVGAIVGAIVGAGVEVPYENIQEVEVQEVLTETIEGTTLETLHATTIITTREDRMRRTRMMNITKISTGRT